MTTPAVDEDEEFTELRDAQISRMDGVGKGANGTKFLLAKQEEGAGLLDPAFVRELVAKAEPAPQPEPAAREQVTMSGSPAAIARLIHEAAIRKATEEKVRVNPWLPPGVVVQHHDEPIAKAKYDTDDRRRMAGHEAMEDGGYPIVDREDLEDAIRAVGRGGADHDAIRRHIEARAEALGATSMIPDNWAADGSLKKESAVADEDMDPMTIMAEPDGTAPGNPTTPGSPAWESVDAATARKWTGILARAKAAIDLLADREMMEAASGADPDDADQAYCLQDACCAIDYAISVLAPFAVAEQAEADCGQEMAAVGKALATFDPAPLDTIEALGAVAKAGRTLSAANEQAIRGAVESLQKVLASLPAAPTTEEEGGRPVAKTEETDMADTQAVPATEETDGTIAKADGEKPKMAVMYDQKGKLVGIVDPKYVMPVANAESDAEPDGAEDEPADTPADDDESAPETPDLEPAPAAEVGTPADAAPSDDDVTKTTTDDATSDDVLKSSILDMVKGMFDEHSATQTDQLAKTGEAVLELAGLVKSLQGQVKALEEQPAEPKVFTHGAVPPREQMRGQDRGAPPVDVTKARELKKGLYGAADAGEQNRIHNEMQSAAIEALQAIHQRRA